MLFKDLEEIKAAVTGSLSIMFGYLADRLTEATVNHRAYGNTGHWQRWAIPEGHGYTRPTAAQFLRLSVSHASACEE